MASSLLPATPHERARRHTRARTRTRRETSRARVDVNADVREVPLVDVVVDSSVVVVVVVQGFYNLTQGLLESCRRQRHHGWI